MTALPLKMLWLHEAIRRRPGMYVGRTDNRAAQARSLVEQALTRLSSPTFANEASRVELRVWPGPAFEFLDDGRGWPMEPISVAGAPMSRIDRVMTELHLEPVEFHQEPGKDYWVSQQPEPDPQSWGPFVGFGAILNALSSRMIVQTAREGVRVEARYSRGGIIAPVHPSSHATPRGTRVLFELDPFLFDAEAQKRASAKRSLKALVSRHPGTTVEWVPEEPVGPYSDSW